MAEDSDKDLEQTKRIMERLVRTPPQPHKPKAEKAQEKDGDTPRRRRPKQEEQ